MAPLPLPRLPLVPPEEEEPFLLTLVERLAVVVEADVHADSNPR